MSDEPGTGETSDTGPTAAEVDARVDGIDKKLDLLLEKFGSGDRGGQAPAAAAGPKPTSVAEEIRDQLARAKAEDDKASAEKGTADRLAAAEAKLTELAEKPPEAPVGKVARALFGRS